jgi:hypothetical protein
MRLCYYCFMKRSRIVILFLGGILLIIAGIFIVMKSANEKNIEPVNNSSSEAIYFTKRPVGSGIPNKIVVAPDDKPNLEIYWVAESVVDGSDVCTLYDTITMQIYATYYKGGGLEPGETNHDTGTKYYGNPKITQPDSQQILDKYCFKG